MLTKIEKRVAIIELVNEMPNVEFKMKCITKLGLVNVSKAKIILSFGIHTLNSLLSLPASTEMELNDGVSLMHYTVYGKQVFAVKRRK